MKESKGFNAATGTSSEGFSRGTNKFAHNQWSGHANDGRLVNFGRGPTKGNTGGDRTPGTCELSSITPGKEMFKPAPQVRNPGGTKEFPKQGQEKFNFGRGPTKGNQL
jgi:hypothetical protein